MHLDFHLNLPVEGLDAEDIEGFVDGLSDVEDLLAEFNFSFLELLEVIQILNTGTNVCHC